MKPLQITALICALAAGIGCSDRKKLIRIDGSSTVYPITRAVAEEFQERTDDARVVIGVSGTGGGFEKFCRGETAITGASRPVRAIERQRCAEAGVRFIELPVAYDGITIAVHPDNHWVSSLTVTELERMWHPHSQGRITRWSQIRSGFPDREFHLFSPGVDSGTFDYFTQAINGEEKAARGDITMSEDDNVLVHGVSTDPQGLGFFGFAYYTANKDRLKVVPIDDGDPTNGEGPIPPTVDNIGSGRYQPLSRPLFLYVNEADVDRPAVRHFVDFFLGEGQRYVEEVGFIPLPKRVYQLARQRFEERKTGSVFEGGSKVGVTVEELLQRDS